MRLTVDIKKKYEDFTLEPAFESTEKSIGILGASGSGKTLTLKSIAGLINPDDGYVAYGDTVLFDRINRINVKPAKRDVGYLFQDYALFPNMTVEGNIKAALHGRRNAGRNKTAYGVEEILKKFELWDIKDHRPKELSGGEKQRTALARMLACDPKLILLDEPFSSMDAFLKEGLRLKLIKILEEYDKTFVLVSHDRDEIYQLCDYLVLMEKGRVIAKGDTDELFKKPETVAAARLTGCKNISRIERLDDHRIRAVEWGGIELVTSDRVEDDITHAGIRAHDLFPADSGVNVIDCGKAALSRMPFEWYVTIECGLWWKVSRNPGSDSRNLIVPEHLGVLPENIMLLKDYCSVPRQFSCAEPVTVQWSG